MFMIVTAPWPVPSANAHLSWREPAGKLPARLARPGNQRVPELTRPEPARRELAGAGRAH